MDHGFAGRFKKLTAQAGMDPRLIDGFLSRLESFNCLYLYEK